MHTWKSHCILNVLVNFWYLLEPQWIHSAAAYMWLIRLCHNVWFKCWHLNFFHPSMIFPFAPVAFSVEKKNFPKRKICILMDLSNSRGPLSTVLFRVTTLMQQFVLKTNKKKNNFSGAWKSIVPSFRLIPVPESLLDRVVKTDHW